MPRTPIPTTLADGGVIVLGIVAHPQLRAGITASATMILGMHSNAPVSAT
jgi:hypothetical protein